MPSLIAEAIAFTCNSSTPSNYSPINIPAITCTSQIFSALAPQMMIATYLKKDELDLFLKHADSFVFTTTLAVDDSTFSSKDFINILEKTNYRLLHVDLKRCADMKDDIVIDEILQLPHAQNITFRECPNITAKGWIDMLQHKNEKTRINAAHHIGVLADSDTTGTNIFKRDAFKAGGIAALAKCMDYKVESLNAIENYMFAARSICRKNRNFEFKDIKCWLGHLTELLDSISPTVRYHATWFCERITNGRDDLICDLVNEGTIMPAILNLVEGNLEDEEALLPACQVLGNFANASDDATRYLLEWKILEKYRKIFGQCLKYLYQGISVMNENNNENDNDVDKKITKEKEGNVFKIYEEYLRNKLRFQKQKKFRIDLEKKKKSSSSDNKEGEEDAEEKEKEEEEEEETTNEGDEFGFGVSVLADHDAPITQISTIINDKDKIRKRAYQTIKEICYTISNYAVLFQEEIVDAGLIPFLIEAADFFLLPRLQFEAIYALANVLLAEHVPKNKSPNFAFQLLTTFFDDPEEMNGISELKEKCPSFEEMYEKAEEELKAVNVKKKKENNNNKKNEKEKEKEKSENISENNTTTTTTTSNNNNKKNILECFVRYYKSLNKDSRADNRNSAIASFEAVRTSRYDYLRDMYDSVVEKFSQLFTKEQLFEYNHDMKENIEEKSDDGDTVLNAARDKLCDAIVGKVKSVDWGDKSENENNNDHDTSSATATSSSSSFLNNNNKTIFNLSPFPQTSFIKTPSQSSMLATDMFWREKVTSLIVRTFLVPTPLICGMEKFEQEAKNKNVSVERLITEKHVMHWNDLGKQEQAVIHQQLAIFQKDCQTKLKPVVEAIIPADAFCQVLAEMSLPMFHSLNHVKYDYQSAQQFQDATYWLIENVNDGGEEYCKSVWEQFEYVAQTP